MKRQAIIIGSNPDTKIPGAIADVHAWEKFLLSLMGGAWNASEIKTLINPTNSQAIINIISNAAYVDYAFIVFSGHGGIYKREKDALGFFETFLYLNNNNVLSERQLNPGKNCPRCTIMIDCCRGHVPELDTILKEASALEDIQTKFSREYFRELFDDQLDRSEKGCVKIYSTSMGSEASDQISFSRILIKSANSYFIKNQKKTILQIDEAVNFAKQTMSNILPQQNPQYYGGRRLVHFPFAINTLYKDKR